MHLTSYLLVFFFSVLALLPIAAWRRSRGLLLPVCGFLLLFLYLWSDFITGDQNPSHDTFYSYKIWYSIINNWASEGVFPLWNPYLGGGQPISLYNNILPSAVAHIFASLFAFIGLTLTDDQFFGLIWTFNFLTICTGTLLLSTLLFSHSFARLLPFVTLLFSPLFHRDLIEPVGYITLAYFPYLLFFLLLFIKERSPSAFLFLAITGGLACNIYLPTYVGITLILFLLCGALFTLLGRGYKEYPLSSFVSFVRRNERAVYGAALLFLLALSPMLYNFAEVHNYVSPTRGYTEAGEIQGHNTGSQGVVTTPLLAYKGLVDGAYKLTFPVDSHSVFTLGVLPGILFFFAFCFPVRKLFLSLSLTALLLIPVGMGPELSLWNFLMDHVPLFNMMRHSFLFSRIISFLFLIAASFGLYALLSSQYSVKRKVIALMAATVFVMFFTAHTTKGWLLPLIPLFLLILLALYSRDAATEEERRILKRKSAIIIAALFLFHITDLKVNIIHENPLFKPKTLELSNAPAYKDEWSNLALDCTMAFNFNSVMQRTITWADQTTGCMFMLQKDFAFFLRDMKLDHPPLRKGKLFYLLPYLSGVSDDHISALFFEPFFAAPKYYLRIEGITEKEKLLVEREVFLRKIAQEKMEEVSVLPDPSPNILTIRTHSLFPRKLIRLENYHHGWSATIDGEKAELHRVFPNFQMLDVPAGEHTIQFQFNSLYRYLLYLQYILMIVSWFALAYSLRTGRLSKDGVLTEERT